MPKKIYSHLKCNLVYKNFLRFSLLKNSALKFSQFQYLSIDSLKRLLRCSSKNVQFRRECLLITLPSRQLFKKYFLEIYRPFQKNAITKTFHSCQMSMLHRIFLKKILMHLLKVKEFFLTC